MSNPGKWVVVTLVIIGVVAALVAWVYTYRQGQRVLEFWGADAAGRIRLAPECQLWTLESMETGEIARVSDANPAAQTPSPLESVASGDDGEPAELAIDGERWKIDRRLPLDRAAGFIHARQALIGDQGYRWDLPLKPPVHADWQYALRFRDANGQTLLLFDLSHGLVMDLESRHVASIEPIADGLRTYFREVLASTPLQTR